jgi:site-specific DNA-methyltransferase (adenine-specific)
MSETHNCIRPYYQDASVTIYHGDNREIIPHLGQFDAVITSPPYNMRTRVNNGIYTKREKTKHFSKKYESYHDALSVDDYRDFQNQVLSLALQRAPLAFWNVQIVTGCKEAWFSLIGAWRKNLKDIIIWDKGDGQPSMHGSVINRGYELIMCFEANQTAGRAFSVSHFQRGTMPDVWRLGRGGSGKVEGNNAIFPIDLPIKIMEGWTRIGDEILDPHGGSGTTARAAKDIGRKRTMIELDEKLCETSARRMDQEVLFLGA